MLWQFPTIPSAWALLSLVYPLAYVATSFYLDWQDRLTSENAEPLEIIESELWGDAREPLGESSEG